MVLIGKYDLQGFTQYIFRRSPIQWHLDNTLTTWVGYCTLADDWRRGLDAVQPIS